LKKFLEEKMFRKKFVERYSTFVKFTMKLADKAKRCGIESLEQEVEDIEETEKVFKEGLRLILYNADPLVVNEILSNMIAHEKCKYTRLYMTIQKRAVLGLQAGEGSYILHKVLSSLVRLTVKESRKLDALLFFSDDDEPEPDAAEDDNNPENESDPFNAKIISLDDSASKIIVKEFDSIVLAHALSPSTKTVRRKIYNNMWRREAAMLEEDIEYMELGNRSEDAQQMILTFIQNDYIPSNNAPRGFDNVGKFKWSDGSVYEGDFVGDKFHGKGKMTFADGGVYEADYVDNKKTGKGKFTWADGETYEGDFVDGKKNGKGKYTYTNGNVYEGDYVDDKENGKGKKTYADGKVEEGEWKDGEFVK
jgi:hypothetical protein